MLDFVAGFKRSEQRLTAGGKVYIYIERGGSEGRDVDEEHNTLTRW